MRCLAVAFGVGALLLGEADCLLQRLVPCVWFFATLAAVVLGLGPVEELSFVVLVLVHGAALLIGSFQPLFKAIRLYIKEYILLLLRCWLSA